MVFILVISPIMLYAQDIDKSIARINKLTRMYDPVHRVFSYDSSIESLNWNDKNGNNFCSADLLHIEVAVEPNGSAYHVTFTANHDSSLIYCGENNRVKTTSITITNEPAAKEIANEVQNIIGSIMEESGYFANYSTDYYAAALANSTGTPYIPAGKTNFIAAITNINNYTSRYDPLKRFFSFDPSTCLLKWVTSDTRITCEIYSYNTSLHIQPSGNEYLVVFSCLEGNKCIHCSAAGYTNKTSITVTDKTYAIKILEEISSLPTAPLDSVPYAGNAEDIQNRIDRINHYSSMYDPSRLKFSFNPYYGLVNYLTADGDTSVDFNPLNVTISNEPAGSNFIVTLKCKDSSGCIQSTYLPNANTTSFAIQNNDIAIGIVEELQGIAAVLNGENSARKTETGSPDALHTAR